MFVFDVPKRANAVSERKKSFRKFDFDVLTNVKRKRASDDETKNIARRIPESTRRSKLHTLMTKQLEQLL